MATKINIKTNYDYVLTVYYNDNSGRTFRNVCLPYLTDEMLAGTKVLTFSDKDGEVFCINFENVNAYSYMLVENAKAEEIPDDQVEVVK